MGVGVIAFATAEMGAALVFPVLTRSTPAIVLPGEGFPGRGGSRGSCSVAMRRRPGIVSRRGEYEAGDCGPSRQGCRPATVFPREGGAGDHVTS